MSRVLGPTVEREGVKDSLDCPGKRPIRPIRLSLFISLYGRKVQSKNYLSDMQKEGIIWLHAMLLPNSPVKEHAQLQGVLCVLQGHPRQKSPWMFLFALHDNKENIFVVWLRTAVLPPRTKSSLPWTFQRPFSFWDEFVDVRNWDGILVLCLWRAIFWSFLRLDK